MKTARRFPSPEAPGAIPLPANKRMRLKIFRNNHVKNGKGGGLRLKPTHVELTQPSAGKNPTATRIRIHKVRFEFVHSTADRVCVAGTFNDWRPETAHMTPLGNGCWQKDFGLPPNTYEYRLVVDGVWMADPLAKETVPNPFGGINSVLKVGQCA